MSKIDLTTAFGGTSTKKYLFATTLGIALVLLAVGFIQSYGHAQAGSPDQVALTSTPAGESSTASTGTKSLYFKKGLVFKRTLAEPENQSIRTSALTDGYKALAVIPANVVAPPVSVRLPQFPNNSTLGNYRALSTLGTQQYYSNLNVQQYFRDLNTQTQMNNLNNQQWLFQQQINTMNTQRYLNNMNTWENSTVLNAQQYLNTLNTQQYMNNFNNQRYLSNWNTFSNSTFTQPTFRQPTFTQPTFRQPTFIQPMPSIPRMPSIPSFRFP